MFFRGKRPTNLGVTKGRLAEGPNKPNWVSSQTERKRHQVSPLSYSGDPAAALQALKACLLAMPRVELIEEKDNYLYFEFATPLMGYVDDVEFYLSDDVIHVRSASRLGYSDLNANRKRVELIRTAFGN